MLAATVAGAPPSCQLCLSVGADFVELALKPTVIVAPRLDLECIRSVLLAEHSRGRPEAMVLAAFSHLSDEDGEVASFVEMDASNVFRHKKGGSKDDAIADAKTACNLQGLWSNIRTRSGEYRQVLAQQFCC